MRRRSAGARAGNALAARGQLAGSAWAALGSDLALWRVNQGEITRVFHFQGGRFYESERVVAWLARPRASSLEGAASRPRPICEFWLWDWLPYWHATEPRKHPPTHSSTHL